MLATLDASPAYIPEACEWLMFKDMHRPIEVDDEFSDGAPSKKSKDASVLASVDALSQQLQKFIQNSNSGSSNWCIISGVLLGHHETVLRQWPL
ncbi:hypothetical protein PI124_g17131 [Phytophthora idaei]|nr:hypothetical protein PI126_g11956 [Phytophthora idaei]KAG3237894.1 hypothetical protein PI124_g17131 [Phytophthora idaei]